MVFSSLAFLCLFLPIFLALYYAFPKLRTVTLAACSLFFYAYGEPRWILALLFSGAAGYGCALFIERFRGSRRAKGALLLSLLWNLGLLCRLKFTGLALPLGVSFYTFRMISYTVDVYRGNAAPSRSPVKFLAYVTMFPLIISGPIARYADLEGDFGGRRLNARLFADGVTRFCVGLAKKVLLADAARRALGVLFYPNAKWSFLGSWLGVAFFAFQLYFDFSGYSDMAIGLGKMLGFEFKENFNYPYIADSITDYWRRWHISLSSFFRDYVYIPLGGNRRHQIFNLLAVWVLTGLWHGTGWNFVLWGLYNAAILIAEKYILKSVLEKLPAALRHVYALILILFSRGLFYFTDAARLTAFVKAAVGVGVPLYDFRVQSVFLSNVFLLAALVIGATPLTARLAARLRGRRLSAVLEPVCNVVLLALCFTAIVGQTYSPFLYAQF
ncbi:MAG: MBOAT family protein [Oscillospiraceae bacterium]|jgi:alginate O-acetyltransferase complex protein AlgI|nr:MBOAT family protein [Oscillospiraceae bacterium]